MIIGTHCPKCHGLLQVSQDMIRNGQNWVCTGCGDKGFISTIDLINDRQSVFMGGNAVSGITSTHAPAVARDEVVMKDIDDFQKATERTMNTDLSYTDKFHMLHYGMDGEFGEVIDLLKKHVFHHHPLEKIRDKMTLEIGDLLWYICRLAGECGITMSDVLKRNGAKLHKRYPEGFDPERSINREE